MKCAMCKREIRGRDYIRVSNPSKEDIYVHEMPCEWYDFKENKDDDAWLGWDHLLYIPKVVSDDFDRIGYYRKAGSKQGKLRTFSGVMLLYW